MGQRSQDSLERLNDGPIYTVHLDAGAFSWIKEIVESKQRYQIYLKGYQRLVKRTLLSLEEAERLVDEEQPAPRTSRVIPRQKARTRSRKP